MISIKTVTVIGATGTMGANIAGIFASFGDAKVYCIARDFEKMKRTIPRIIKSVKADGIAKNLIPADYSMLEKCVLESDLIFESVAESLEIKEQMAKRIGRVLKSSAISCTGTSGLSVTALAECYPVHLRKQFFGVHMFNPPYSMSLCEFVSTKYSDVQIADELKKYLIDKLYRTVVDVKDTPAFLGNRIGFQFINEALQYAEKYADNGGIDYIDAILGSFTGRAMAPIVTSDFVGLDVHKAIVDNIYKNTSDYAKNTFILPEYVQKLVNENKLGRKSGAGLYQIVHYDNGLKRQTVYDIKTGMYRDQIPYAFPFADKMRKSITEGDYVHAMDSLINNNALEARICLAFLLKYIVYSLYSAQKVAYSISAADDVMATGFNWCPPLALCQALSMVVDVKKLVKERLPELCESIDVDSLFGEVKPSKYDYRPYFKSGR